MTRFPPKLDDQGIPVAADRGAGQRIAFLAQSSSRIAVRRQLTSPTWRKENRATAVGRVLPISMSAVGLPEMTASGNL